MYVHTSTTIIASRSSTTVVLVVVGAESIWGLFLYVKKNSNLFEDILFRLKGKKKNPKSTPYPFGDIFNI